MKKQVRAEESTTRILIVFLYVFIAAPLLYGQAVCDAPLPHASPEQSARCAGALAQCTQNPGPATCDPVVSGPQACGEWTDPFTVCTKVSGGLCSGVHAALIGDTTTDNSGNVLLWYKSNQGFPPAPSSYVLSNLMYPHCSEASNDCVSTEVPTPFTYDMLCAGMSIGSVHDLTSGLATTVIATGGMIDGDGNNGKGITNTTFFAPSGAGGAWSQGPAMNDARYYPSNVQMSDGRTLVLSGTDVTVHEVTQMERFDGSSGIGSWSIVLVTV